MPFNTPNLPTLITRTSADIDASDSLRRSDAAVIARAHSAVAFGLYGYLAWLYEQGFVDSAEEEALLRHGYEMKIDRKQPTYASGNVVVTGTTGSPIDETARLAINQILYEVTTPVILVDGTAIVNVRAVSTGIAGNQLPNTILEFSSPVTGVNSATVVDGNGLTGGTDLEDIEDYRARVLERKQKTPHGGNADDHETWAKEEAGVTRAWCKRNWVGPGTVAVFIVNDDADPITPNEQALNTVKAGIDKKRHVCGELYVLAPTLRPVNYILSVTPDTARVRAAVEYELKQLHAANSELGVRLLRTHITAAISSAAGEEDHNLVEPAGDVIPAQHELLEYGSVTWL